MNANHGDKSQTYVAFRYKVPVGLDNFSTNFEEKIS